MKEDILSFKGKDFFPNLEKDFWKNRKERDYLIQSSTERDEVQVFSIPKPIMKSILKEVTKRQNKRNRGF